MWDFSLLLLMLLAGFASATGVLRTSAGGCSNEFM
jgi:hypothetical protein